MQWLLGIIHAILKIVANRTDPEVMKQKRKEKVEAKVEAAVKASREKDAEKVNAILRSKWFKCAVIFVGCTALQGCVATQPMMIVPKAEVALPVEYEGVPGWFVPQPLFERMLEAVVRQQEKE
jgi:hypothetical protein